MPCKQRTPYIIIVAKCGTIVERESNTKKFERANEGALQYVYKDKGTLCTKLLEWIALHNTSGSRRVQEMMIRIERQ